MEDKEETIKKINDLSMQFSYGFIQYEKFREKRKILLDVLDGLEDKTQCHAGLMEMVGTFTGFIKRN